MNEKIRQQIVAKMEAKWGKPRDIQPLTHFSMPVVQRSFPKLMMEDICGVQPMTSSSTTSTVTYSISESHYVSNIDDVEGICTCECHQDGKQIMHMFPCCPLSGEKYIFENGEIDVERLEDLLDGE